MMSWSIDYSANFRPTPFSRWVHKSVHKRVTGDSARTFKEETRKMVVEFEPPVPVVVGQGYPLITVEVEGGVLKFASLHEMEFVLNAIEEKRVADEPWLEDLPEKAFAPENLGTTTKLIQNVYNEVRALGELG